MNASERISDTFKKIKTLDENGVQNGNITKFRIVASGVIGLVSIVGGVFLIYTEHEVPSMFWYIAIGALSGVVGLDLLTSMIKAARA